MNKDKDKPVRDAAKAIRTFLVSWQANPLKLKVYLAGAEAIVLEIPYPRGEPNERRVVERSVGEPDDVPCGSGG